jgi:hypothetical protein
MVMIIFQENLLRPYQNNIHYGAKRFFFRNPKIEVLQEEQIKYASKIIVSPCS